MTARLHQKMRNQVLPGFFRGIYSYMMEVLSVIFGSTRHQSWLPYIVLILLGLLINTVKLPILPGIDLLFGGISIFLIMHRYSVAKATIAAAIISIPTWFFWSHPVALALFTLEAFIISYIYKRYDKSLVFIAPLYGVLVGIPLLCLFYMSFLQVNLAAGFYIGLKDTANSIFNALIASLLITWIPWGMGKNQRVNAPLNRVLFEIIVACITLPIFCVSIIHVNHKFTEEITKVKEGLAKETIQLSHMIETWEKEHLQEISRLSLSVTSQDIGNPADLQERLFDIRQTSLYLNVLYVADSNGTVVAISPVTNPEGQTNMGLNFSDRPYYKELLATKKNVVSSVLVGRGSSGKPIVTMNSPIMENSQLVGYVSGSLNLDFMRNRLRESSENHAMFTLVDQEGKVIVSSDPKLSALIDFKQTRLDGQLTDAEPIYYWDINEHYFPRLPKWDRSYYLYERQISDEIPWTLIAESPLNPIRNYLQYMYSLSFAIIILSTFIAFFIANLVSRLITKPLRSLAEITTHLPDKMANRINIIWPTSTIREIHSLINNYVHTSDVLKDNFLQSEYMANHDPLTGLPNRRLFNNFFNAMREDAGSSHRKLGIMSFDIDRFKFVNDSLGHAVGDDLLRMAAGRLIQLAGNKEKSLRLGGDEFVSLFSGADIEELGAKANSLCKAFREPFIIDGRTFFVSVSVGVTVYPDDGLELEHLLRKADIALYRTKEQGKNGYQFYSTALGKANDEDYAIETALRTALEERQFSIVYQPQYNLEKNKIVGVEALLRWVHPTLGYIPPNKFIPIAEKMGLIRSIGEWVLRTACHEISSWRLLGYPALRVAVNVSSLQFDTTDFVHVVEDVLRTSKLPPSHLELEITEGVAIKNIGHTMGMLESLSQMGVKVALDDFGTGFSSLGYLTKFQIDTLKVDMSFVREIASNHNSRAVVASIISLAKTLSLKVIAEGVETEEQQNMLKDLGCDEIQGYYISKPLPVEDMKKLVIQN